MKRLKTWAIRFWNSWGREVAIVLTIMIPFRSSIADWNQVPTGSMKPTILEGDRVFVNKLAYDLKAPLTTWHLAEWGNPERGDIVVFFSPADGKRLVKRVVGVPGDVVGMRNNRLILNGQPVEYESLGTEAIEDIPDEERHNHLFAGENLESGTHPVMMTPNRPAMRSFGPVTVPDGQYVALGDNRDNSADSRFFGFVDRKQIVGRVPAVVASFDRDNFYLPRRKRWLKRLP